MPPNKRQLSKRELLDYANSLPDDEPEDDGVAVHVVKVKKDDPNWAWLFGGSDDSTEQEEEEGEEGEEETEDKQDPKPKPRNKFFGGQ